MNRQTRLDRIAEEVKTIPRKHKSGREVDERYFEAYVKHVVVGGQPAPQGALHFALMHLEEDPPGPPPAWLEKMSEDVMSGPELTSGPEPVDKEPRRLTGTQKRALSRWYGCLIKGLPIPPLLARQLWGATG
jgi:hypothetical protein